MNQPELGVIAHRGNMSEFPENTMPSFESAIQNGAGWIELDIQRTRDGKLVVTHDESALRVAGSNLVIVDTDYMTLKTLNFGAYFSDGKFYKVPLLDEVFDLISRTNTRVTIQPKGNGLIKEAYKMALKVDMVDRIGFNDINCEYLIEVKNINPKIPVFWDRLPYTDLETDLFVAGKFGFETLMYLKEAITEKKINAVAKQGITFGACVVNDGADMAKFLDMGIETFYTDYPKQLIELKKGKKK